MCPRGPVPHKLVGKLSVDTESGAFLGDTRIRLLEAIDRHGSISRAAKAVPLSYKAAWDAVDAMNNLADAPLVERSVGGRQGGGTALTAYGRQMIALYRAVEQEYQGAIDRLVERLGDADPGSVRQFQTLLRRMSMRTSARNQFVGTVVELRAGDVDVEVALRLDDANLLRARITRASVENLALAVGKSVHAFVKAPSVDIVTDGLRPATADNLWWGEVGAIHHGAVSAEVTLVLPGGRSVTALVSDARVAALGLAVGGRAGAVCSANAVILAVFD